MICIIIIPPVYLYSTRGFCFLPSFFDFSEFSGVFPQKYKEITGDYFQKFISFPFALFVLYFDRNENIFHNFPLVFLTKQHI